MSEWPIDPTVLARLNRLGRRRASTRQLGRLLILPISVIFAALRHLGRA